MERVEERLGGMGFGIGTPREDHRRGGHVALEHEEAARICEALKASGVVPDFRAPNIIRLSPVALYTSYHDVWQTVDTLGRVIEEKAHEKYSNERGVVA